MRKYRKPMMIAFLALGVLIAGSLGMTSMSWSADGAALKVEMSGLASEFRVVYSITISNPSSSTIREIYVAGSLPEGASFVETTNTPVGASSLGKQGSTVAWLVSEVPGGGKAGPFSYKVSVAGRTAGAANAWTSWQSPAIGSALSEEVTFAEVTIDGPKRGCQACHVLRDEKTGSVTIAYEAMLRGGPNHPKLEFTTTVDQCLGCHAPGTGEREGMGVVAPKMLRDIVHPVHLNSSGFINNYKGNCFTCHNVDGQGRFTLLGSKLKTDFRGIPKAPVQGIQPSQLWLGR